MKLFCKALLSAACLLMSMSLWSQKLPPIIEWQKSLGGSKVDRAYSVIRTLDNGYLVAGLSFSNDGQVSGHHGSTDSSDAWVAKLDNLGNLQWQRSLGGTGTDEFRHAVQAPNGDFLFVGSSLSNDGDVSGNHGQGDLWVCRLNSSGTLLWSKLYGGDELDAGHVLRRAVDGGYVVSGYAYSGNGDINNHIGFADIWVLKINDSGVIQWQKKYGNYNDQYTNDMIVTSDNSYIITGYSRWRGDPTCIGSPMYAFYASYSLKLDAAGNIIWQNIGTLSCGNPGRSDYSANTIEMPGGQLFRIGNRINATTESYATLTFSRATAQNQTVQAYTQNANLQLQFPQVSATFNGNNANSAPMLPDSSIVSVLGTPGSTVAPRTQATLVRIDTRNVGSVINAYFKKEYGGSNDDYFRSIAVVNEWEYVAAGYSNSNNGDVSGNHGDYDCWIVKFNELNTVKGTVFVDNNGNGIKDGADNYFTNARVSSTKGTATVASATNSLGQFLNRVDTGSYSTTVNLIKPYFTINPATKTSVFTAYNTKDSFSFALVPIPNKKDLRVVLNATSPIRPGFEATYSLSYVNEGTEIINNVVVKLLLPFNIDFISSLPASSSYANDTATWNIGTLAPLNGATINIKVKADPPPAFNIGDVPLLVAIAEPVAGDETPLDNRDSSIRRATGSYDPNDKAENVDGTLRPDQLGQQYLTYTIRFQNTGTDTAFNIVIRDTLDAKLDWQSLQMVSSSHVNHFAIREGYKLAWTFTNILLPDSNTNEPLSHGYVTYRIKPKSSLVIGDVITNSASIYFDFNPPVRTNTTQTTVRPVVVPQPSVSGVAANYCSTQGVQRGKLNNLPAPGSGVTAGVKLDANSLAIAADSTFGFDVSTLSAGTHVIEVTYSNGTEVKTAIINFNVTAAVTPDVNVSASATTAVNLLDPIILTAANAAGGGSNPLYTFGKDRNFTNVWQAESSSTVFSLQPTALLNGDNWIYVRMKTSSTCFTTQFNTDSIKITLQLPVPEQPVLTGINANYCLNEGLQKVTITNYPGAGTGATVTAKIDGNVVTIAADFSFGFSVATLGAGNHAAEVTFSNLSGTRTTRVDFSIVAPVTPDVNVTASVRNVSSLTEPVVITAANAAGGGQSPTFTFAGNRTFTDIIQAEGAYATLTLTPAALRLGENRLYVRMKTSSSCYTQQTAIDSVSITRYGSKGLVDADYPDQIISCNPNPFRGQLQVYGLSAGKTYTLLLYNQQGKVMRNARVSGRTLATLAVQGLTAGGYLLSVYDETKKTLIGTLAVMKQ